MNATDILNGGSGTDTITITYAGTANASTEATNGALINAIEIFNIRNTGVDAAGATNTLVALDASKTAGVTNVNAYLSSGNVAVSNLATGAAVGITGNGTLVQGGLNYAYKTLTDAVTINLANGVNQTAGVAAAATVGAGGGNAAGVGISAGAGSAATVATINSTGAANKTGGIQLSAGTTVTALTINADSNLTVLGAAADGNAEITGFKNGVTTNTITVKGAATSVNIGEIDATVGTVDASGLTAGGVTLQTLAATTKVVGGAGKDVVTVFNGSAITATLDGGAGTADTIVFASAANYLADAAKVSNFETLRVNAGAISNFNFASITGLTNLEIASAANALTVSNLGAATPITVLANTVAATTLSLATNTDADTLNVTLKSSASTPTAVAVGTNAATGLITNAVETLAITSNGALAAGTSDTLWIGTGTTGLKTISIAAASDSDLTLNTTASASLTKIDGALFTKALSVTVGTPATTLTVLGGSGNDKVIETGAVANTSVTIDGGAGTNTLEITDTTALTDTAFKNITNIQKLLISNAAGDNVVLAGNAGAAITQAGGVLTVTETGTAAAGTTAGIAFDASGLKSTAAIKGTFTTNGAATSNAITGGDGNDTVTFDQITNNKTAGTSIITGGKGADALTLGHTATIDYTINFALGDVVSGTTQANADTITGFSNTATDKIQLSVANGTLTSHDGTVTGVGGAKFGADTGDYSKTGNVDLTVAANKVLTVIDLTSTTAIKGSLATQAGVNEAVTDITSFVKATAVTGTNVDLIVHDALGNAVVFNYTEAGTAGIQAAELTLVGTLTGVVGAFAAADVV